MEIRLGIIWIYMSGMFFLATRHIRKELRKGRNINFVQSLRFLFPSLQPSSTNFTYDPEVLNTSITYLLNYFKHNISCFDTNPFLRAMSAPARLRVEIIEEVT